MDLSDYISAAPLEAYDETAVPGQVIVDLLAALGLEPKYVAAVHIEPDVIEIDVWVLANGAPAKLLGRPVVNTIRRRIVWAPTTVDPEADPIAETCWRNCSRLRCPFNCTGRGDHIVHLCEVHR